MLKNTLVFHYPCLSISCLVHEELAARPIKTRKVTHVNLPNVQRSYHPHPHPSHKEGFDICSSFLRRRLYLPFYSTSRPVAWRIADLFVVEVVLSLFS